MAHRTARGGMVGGANRHLIVAVSALAWAGSVTAAAIVTVTVTITVTAAEAEAAEAAEAAKLPRAGYLPLEMAQKAANAAMARCIADGYRVSVAVVARAGSTKVLIRGDGAGPHTVGSSTGKAFTSASMGRPSGKLAKLIADKPFLAGLRDMDRRLVILGGGLPIKIAGQLVGGIGVGGAPGGHLDEACALAGIKAIAGE